MTRHWSTLIVLLSVLSASGAFASVPGTRVSNCENNTSAIGTSYWYTLIEVNTADATDASYFGADSVDKVVIIGKQTNVGTIADVTTAGNYCGNKWSGSAWVSDTRFPTGSTYSETFAVHLASDNSKGARFPRNMFLQKIDPNPGTKFGQVEKLSDTGTCRLDDSGSTSHYFYKACLSQ